MVWGVGVAVAVFKPFVLIWAGLNAIDDLSLLMRVGRLCAVAVPFPGRRNRRRPDELCDVCDDVMGDLLPGDGLSAVPCGAACLGIGKCVDMCEAVKEASATSTQFPCVAAGYCDAVEAGVVGTADPEECRAGPLFSCQPRRFCRRRRRRFRMTCELRPGIGRWVGMKHAAGAHAVALAEGLVTQKHCGEEGAGPYCIARPTGLGVAAEMAGYFISLFIGGYKSVVAIETPGGSDDRQWLTFWLILAITLFVERFFARVILSTVPFYYEAKLSLLVWLVWRSGADICYRKLRRVLVGKNLIHCDSQKASKQLAIMKATGKGVVEKRLAIIRKVTKERESKPSIGDDWEYDRDGSPSTSTDSPDEVDQLYELSKFLLSTKGAAALEKSTELSEQDACCLVERAASVVSFQPRFVRVRLQGTIDEPRGELPPMDRNGVADAYVTCRLVADDGVAYPKKGVTSRTSYSTLRPQWDEELELPLRGGTLASDGFYHSDDAAGSTVLHVDVRDADVGRWGVAYRFFNVAIVGIAVAAAAARIEGISDDLTETQRLAALLAALLVVGGYILSYVMAVMKRSDDEHIGECVVPLGMLMDQREHSLLLTIREPEPVEEKGAEDGSVTITNSVGGLGVFRVRLCLSEH